MYSQNSESYSECFFRQLRCLAKCESFVDVNLIVEEKIYPCHKVILSASSVYFEKMFTSGFSEAKISKDRSKVSEVHLNGISRRGFDVIYTYIYSGELRLEKENVFDVYDTSDMLLYENVKRATLRYVYRTLHLNHENALQYWLASQRRGMDEIIEMSLSSIINHFDSISQDVDFVHVPFDTLLGVLELEEQESENEGKLLRSVKRWTENQSDITRMQCQKLISQIRWGLLMPSDFDDFSTLCQRALSPCLGSGEEFGELSLDSAKTIVATHTNATCPEKILLEQKYGPFFQTRGIQVKTYVVSRGDSSPQFVDIPTQANCMTAVRCGNHIVATGGYSTQAYDMKHKMWTPLANMNVYRHGHAAISVGKCIIVVGGVDEKGKALNSFEVFDIGENKWKPMETFLPLVGPLGVCYRNEAYICGGHFQRVINKCLYKYDFSVNEWHKVCTIPEGVYKACVSDDMIYMRLTSGYSLLTFDGLRVSATKEKPERTLIGEYQVLLPESLLSKGE